VLLEYAIQSHLDALVIEGRSPHTVRNARSALKELAAFLSRQGIASVEQMSHDILMQFRRELCSRPTRSGSHLSPGSQREHVGKLRTFCRWLFEVDWIGVDLGKRIPQPRKGYRLPKAILEIGEVDRILASPDMSTAAGYRDRVILEVLYSTAIRRQEAATLVLNDIDTRGGYVTVRNGKNGKDRVVPIGTSACEVLQGFLGHIRPLWPGADRVPQLFLTRFGFAMQPAGIWHVVKKYARIAGIRKPVSTHTFRHTCATQMARAGVPIRHLQELLGHESVETTQIYTQLAIADLKAAHRRFHPRDNDSAFRHLRVAQSFSLNPTKSRQVAG
jgi:integrase/recombinase XerD